MYMIDFLANKKGYDARYFDGSLLYVLLPKVVGSIPCLATYVCMGDLGENHGFLRFDASRPSSEFVFNVFPYCF